MQYLHIRYTNGQAEVVAYPNAAPELPHKQQGFLRVKRAGQPVKWVNLANVAALTIYEPVQPRYQKVLDLVIGPAFAGLFIYAALFARGKQQISISIALLLALAVVQMLRRGQVLHTV